MLIFEFLIGMGNMGDLSAWNAAQPYAASNIGYGHTNVSQAPRQSQAQQPNAYRQHMSAYGAQQDPQKIQYPTQQGMMSGMMQQQSYSNIGAQQATQQRVPQQHYGQSPHPIYPNPPQAQQNQQAYSGYGAASTIPHQGRSAQQQVILLLNIL